MPLLNRLVGGLRALVRRQSAEHDLDEELRGYLEISAAEKMERGLDPVAAHRAARLEIGIEVVKDQVRDAGWDSVADSLWHDIRYTLRMWRRSPVFTVVAITSLALGIGANTAVFTLLDALVLRTMPVLQPEDLVQLAARPRGSVISFPMYQDLRDRQQAFTDIAATQAARAFRLTIRRQDGPAIELDNVAVAGVTGNYFGVLGIQAAAGRFFTADDDRGPNGAETAGSVIVLSDALWDRQFGRDPQAIGRTILVNRSACRIVGVAPAGFTGERVASAPDAWVPLIPFNPPNNLEGRRGTFTAEIARLKPGVTRQQAEAMLTTLFRQLLRAEAIVKDDVDRYSIAIEPAGAGIDSGVRLRYVKPLGILMAIAGLVLLIACANIGNLLLARAAARRGEIAVRLAVGCSRGRLIRQLLTESLLLAIVSAAVGIAIAYVGTRALLQMVDTNQVAMRLDVPPDLRVLSFLAAIAILTGVAFGLVPSLRATRVDPSAPLQAARRGSGTGGGTGQRMNRLLVTLQVAISLLLLITAGLLVSSFRNLHAMEWGFRPEHVVVFDLQHNPRNREPAVLGRLADELQRRVGALPGVESASVSWILLFSTADQRTPLQIPGYTPPPEESARFAFIGDNIVMVRFNPVSPTYFRTVGMSLVGGRLFDHTDTAAAPPVAIINESLARRYFGPAGAIGREFSTVVAGGAVRRQIVGIVKDSKYNNLRDEVMPMFYAPIAQMPRELRGLEVRTREPAGAIAAAVRQSVADVTKDIMIQRVATLSEQVDRSLSAERLMMRLSSFFGGVALLLACIGLYGVLAYQVAQRTGEIGIRLALGATRRSIVGLVLGETAWAVASGLVGGVLLAFGTTRLLTTFLFGLAPMDPQINAVAVAILVGFAGLAAFVPSYRAANVDPNVALRDE